MDAAYSEEEFSKRRCEIVFLTETFFRQEENIEEPARIKELLKMSENLLAYARKGAYRSGYKRELLWRAADALKIKRQIEDLQWTINIGEKVK